MRLSAFASLALLAAAPLSAKAVTVGMGETWVFAIANGQLTKAHKVAATSKPAAGEIKVTVQPLMGTTMTISNNSKFDYAYRAVLILANGKAGPTKSCAVPANGRMAMEHWPQRVAAVRLDRFKPAPAGSLCP